MTTDPDDLLLNLFGDPDYVEERAVSKNIRRLKEGDGKHFLVAFIGDQEIECKIVCEWDESDHSAPCWTTNGCLVVDAWSMTGRDLLERNPDETQILAVKLPVGYRTQGHNDEFEDYIYSVRPKPASEFEDAARGGQYHRTGCLHVHHDHGGHCLGIGGRNLGLPKYFKGAET